MSPLRLNGSTSGYAELAASAAAGDVVLTIPNAAGTLDRLNRAGNILQVVSTVKTDTFTTTSTSFVDVTGLSVSITPTSASSKVLVFVSVTLGHPINNLTLYRLMRDAVEAASSTGNTFAATGSIYFQDANIGNGVAGTSISVLDAPSSTSSLTYKIQLRTTGGTSVLNRRTSSVDYGGVSSVTLMEVAA